MLDWHLLCSLQQRRKGDACHPQPASDAPTLSIDTTLLPKDDGAPEIAVLDVDGSCWPTTLFYSSAICALSRQ